MTTTILAAVIAAVIAFAVGFVVCAVITSGKAEEQYLRGYLSGLEEAAKHSAAAAVLAEFNDRLKKAAREVCR